MPRDYAKRATKSAKGKRSRNKKRDFSWRVLLVTLVTIALFGWLLWYLGAHKNFQANPKVIQHKQTVAPERTKPEPKFDFYTILPNDRVEIASPKQNGKRYYLQVAAFEKYENADQLRAQLALLGFDAYITKVMQGKQELDRVDIGPYLSKEAAVADEHELASNNIKSEIHQDV